VKLNRGNILFKTLLLLYGLTVFLWSASFAIADDDVKDSIVKLYTVNNRYNYHEPWVMKGQNTFHGSGSIIGGGRVLTNAHVVSDHMFIQVRRAGQAKKYTAKVEIIGHETDLAIVRIDDKSFFANATPLELGDLPELKDSVSVYGFPDGGDKLSLTEGIVSRVEHTNYSHSGAYLLTGQIDAPINSGNSGGPVLKEGKIVGVAFQSLTSASYNNIGYMVPAPVIKHFLQDIEDGKHDGTPDLGVSMQQMENPDLRKSFRMIEDQTGVLVSRVYPDSPAEGILKRGDIILSIEGVNVANDGTIEFRKGERTFFTYTLQQKQKDDFINLNVLRAGKEETLTIQLTKSIDFERLVPHRRYDVPPTYYIIGGLVFEPLTLNYLMEFGENWNVSAPTELVNYYMNGEPLNNRREVIVLVKVLADEFNIGYHTSQNVVIVSVNGIQVSSMKDLVNAFEDYKGEYHVIEDTNGFLITLSRRKAGEANAGILRKYKISSDRSDDLRQQ